MIDWVLVTLNPDQFKFVFMMLLLIVFYLLEDDVVEDQQQSDIFVKTELLRECCSGNLHF